MTLNPIIVSIKAQATFYSPSLPPPSDFNESPLLLCINSKHRMFLNKWSTYFKYRSLGQVMVLDMSVRRATFVECIIINEKEKIRKGVSEVQEEKALLVSC